jgi:Flp pilus assembly protein TadD
MPCKSLARVPLPLADAHVLTPEVEPAITWQARFDAAEALFAEGAFSDAEAEYAAVIAAAPKHLPANIGASRCARKRGDYAASLRYFDAAAAANQTHIGVLMERASDLKILNRHAEAAAAYNQVIEIEPKNMHARLGLGECARHRGDRAAALEIYRAAALAAPDNPWPLIEVAVEHHAAGNWEAAEDAYVQCLVIAPDNLQAWLGMGHCARRHGNRRISFALFQAGSLAAPGNPWPLLEAATDLRELGRLAEAEALYTRVLATAPGNAQALLGLAKCQRLRGDRAAAIAHLRAAILAAPGDPWPLLDLAADLRALNQLDEAESACRRALEIAPSQPQAHIGLGHCARQRGDRPAALRIFTAAVAALPHEPWLRIERAADLRHLGRLDEAAAECRHVLVAAPDNVHAHLGLGDCARGRGDRKAAIAIYRAAILAAPHDPWPRVELAADLREMQETAQAEALYNEVLTMLPGNVQALLGLGFCARLRGDRAAARARFEAAIKADPADPAPALECAAEQRDAGDPDAAIATAKAVLANHPGNIHALLSIGQSERYAARHEAALAAFTAAHQAHPATAEPLVEMAVSARTLGRQPDCDAWLARALAIDPRNVSAIVRRAEQAMIAQNIGEALAIYQQAAAEQPGQLAFRLGAADALAGAGQSEAAIAALEALAAEHGDLPAITGMRINLLRQTGELHAALALARAAARANPANVQLWSELFHTEMLAGTAPRIAACLAAAPAHTAHQKAALRRHQGQFAETCWRYAEALADYEAAAAANPHDAGLQQDLARIKTLFLDLDGARRHLRNFCDLTADATRLRKKSLNLSQTQYGQILDEYRLDREVLDAVRPQLSRPPEAQCLALTGLVRANPDSTVTAVSLMIALRQAGAFAPRPAPAAGAAIPKRIMQFWDAPAPPADIARLMATWQSTNPDHSYRLFNNLSAQEFLADHFPPAMLHAYRRGEYATQKSDIFRLAFLAAEGGIYADADDRCTHPVSTIIPGGAKLVVYQDEHMTLCNNFIAAAPGHPVILAALEAAVRAMLRGDRDTVWFSTGPALLTRAFTQVLVARRDRLIDPAASGIAVLDRRELACAVSIHCAAAYKRTGRHWLNATFGGRNGMARHMSPRGLAVAERPRPGQAVGAR